MLSSRLKSPFLWTIIILLLISIGLLVPEISPLQFSLADRNIRISIPQFPKTIYFWGRPLTIRPDHLIDLEYQPGTFFVFELAPDQDPDIEANFQENVKSTSLAISNRINNFYSWPAKTHLLQEEKQYLIVETMNQVDQEVISTLATLPGKLNFHIQDQEIDQEELIFSDSWDEGFELIDIDNQNVVNATAQIDFQSNQPMVVLTFDDQGKSILFRVTRENTENLLMASIDGSIALLSPIREPIHTGRISISGGRSLEQAKVISSSILNPLSMRVEVPEDVVELDLSQLSNQETTQFLGLFEMSVLHSQMMIIGLLLIILSLLSIFSFSHEGGFILSSLLWLLVIASAAFSRSMRMVVDGSFFIALKVVIVYWWLSASGVLLYARKIKARLKISRKESLLKSLSLKNNILRRSGALLLLSATLLISLANSRYLGDRFSANFSQVMFGFSLLATLLSMLFLVAIRDLINKKEET